MNKVMVIIDEPKTCEDCPCVQSEMNYETIDYNYCGLDFHEIETCSKRDANCPLKPMERENIDE